MKEGDCQRKFTLCSFLAPHIRPQKCCPNYSAHPCKAHFSNHYSYFNVQSKQVAISCWATNHGFWTLYFIHPNWRNHRQRLPQNQRRFQFRDRKSSNRINPLKNSSKSRLQVQNQNGLSKRQLGNYWSRKVFSFKDIPILFSISNNFKV